MIWRGELEERVLVYPTPEMTRSRMAFLGAPNFPVARVEKSHSPRAYPSSDTTFSVTPRCSNTEALLVRVRIETDLFTFLSGLHMYTVLPTATRYSLPGRHLLESCLGLHSIATSLPPQNLRSIRLDDPSIHLPTHPYVALFPP